MEIQSNSEALLLRLLAASSQRSRTIANNIANQNTPGYRRQVVRFEELLEQSVAEGRGDLLQIEPMVTTDQETPGRLDGNNVNLELEVNAARENRVLSETYLTLLQGHYMLLNTAIAGGAR